jgi:uncharacterized protein (TIGR02246 family)
VSVEIIDRYFAAVNAGDWTALAELFAADALLVATGAPARHGRDAVVAHYPHVLAPFAEHVDTPTRQLRAGDTVVVEIAFTGRLHDGRPIAFDAVDIFDLAGDRIARLSSWYDTAAVSSLVATGRGRPGRRR